MILVMLAILGLIVGSFINAFVWRLRAQELQREKRVKLGTEAVRQNSKPEQLPVNLSILTGRSMCTDCHHVLSAWDLIPVLSWVYLKGKCRYCRKPISWQYPVVELFTSFAYALSYYYWPMPVHYAYGIFSLCLWLFFLSAFIALAIYDIRWYLLPDRIIFPLIGIALIEMLSEVAFFHAGWHMVFMAFLSVSFLAGLFFILHVSSGGTWIGFGDVKLAVVLGMLAATPINAMLLLFLAAALGTIFALPLLLRGKATAKTQLPFGPFLLTAGTVVVLFGTRIVYTYTHLFTMH